ncbi:DORMANCY-ASSOCIATED PROTEIN-like protein 4 [Salix viminalis]|uniref:DORMANCY-ASSOCIATED PROTEIN-like protein 4 n=1 Tax=Salix viminalis TaxID=40686 RepID=A0A9Q0T7G3_SALVM|nr:DORMANCY-ASSOCIATED PROTEIN-like protein 4 [Salix viminalis]
MGFLHKLWNETLAGPMPDSTGLGELLRKYDSFSARSSPPADNSSNEEMNITRSITIVRTNCSKYLRSISVDPCSATPLTGKLPSYVSGLSTVHGTFYSGALKFGC